MSVQATAKADNNVYYKGLKVSKPRNAIRSIGILLAEDKIAYVGDTYVRKMLRGVNEIKQREYAKMLKEHNLLDSDVVSALFRSHRITCYEVERELAVAITNKFIIKEVLEGGFARDGRAKGIMAEKLDNCDLMDVLGKVDDVQFRCGTQAIVERLSSEKLENIVKMALTGYPNHEIKKAVLSIAVEKALGEGSLFQNGAKKLHEDIVPALFTVGLRPHVKDGEFVRWEAGKDTLFVRYVREFAKHADTYAKARALDGYFGETLDAMLRIFYPPTAKKEELADYSAMLSDPKKAKIATGTQAHLAKLLSDAKAYTLIEIVKSSKEYSSLDEKARFYLEVAGIADGKAVDAMGTIANLFLGIIAEHNLTDMALPNYLRPLIEVLESIGKKPPHAQD